MKACAIEIKANSYIGLEFRRANRSYGRDSRGIVVHMLDWHNFIKYDRELELHFTGKDSLGPPLPE